MSAFTSKEAKMLSKIGTRAAYGMFLMELIAKNENVFALSADLGGSSGLGRMREVMPHRFINTGIAEQSLISVSAGLAKEGLIPFASSFAPFITGRCFDFIRMNLGYMNLNVKLVGLGCGVGMGELGHSHYGWEDIALLRSIPNMTIICPSDCGMIKKCLYAAALRQSPTYIRLTNTLNVPIVYEEDFDFEIGKAITLKSGDDVALIATGSMVHTSLKAAEILEQNSISCSVIDLHTIKPLDEEAVLNACKSHKLIATIEEHSIIGGLGGAIAEFKARIGCDTRQIIIGLPDSYGHTADYSYQLEKYGLCATQIAQTIQSHFN